MTESTSCQFIPSVEGARIASEFPFYILCKLFERLSCSQVMKKKKEALSAFIRNWVIRYENQIEKNSAIAAGVGSFYPVLRLLLPSYDYSRPAYGIGQSTMARICVKAFGLAPKGLSARTLLHFNNPKFSGKQDGRDLADCVFSVLADYCEAESDLTISGLHEQLDKIAYASKQEEKLEILTPFIRSLSALELKWFVRIVSLRELHLGLSTKTVLTCVHPAAPSIWNVTQDLCTVCQRIAGIIKTQPVEAKSSLSIAGHHVTLNAAYRPMLCMRANSALEVCIAYEKVFSGIADYCLCLEAKYDGERVQLHKSGDKYRYWSRSGREWSYSYGTEGNGTTGTLTPRLHVGGFSSDVSECVLDGEMFGFDTYTDTFITKATGFDVKRPYASGGSDLFLSKAELDNTARKAAIVPCYIVFDILHLNGEVGTLSKGV
uniref:DNA ligase 4 n=1 Tax=Schistocephalus solidus TaxID=70667 RepID=A0A0X3NQ42_SCHSO